MTKHHLQTDNMSLDDCGLCVKTCQDALWLYHFACTQYAMGLIVAFLFFYLCCVPMVMDLAMSCMIDFVADCLCIALMVSLCSPGGHVCNIDHLHHAATLFPPANGPPITVYSSTHAPLVQYCLESLLGFKEGLKEGLIAHS